MDTKVGMCHSLPNFYMDSLYLFYLQVKAGEAKSVFFPIVPAALGPISLTVKAQSTLAADAVKRQLLVEVRKRNCLRNCHSVFQTFSL